MTKRSVLPKLAKTTRHKHSNDDLWYHPRMSKVDKAAQHAKNQAIYRARHPEMREKERLRSAQRRATTKAARRCRDPPKQTPSINSINTKLHNPPSEDAAPNAPSQALSQSTLSFQDYRARDYFILEDARATAPVRVESELPGAGSGRCSPTPDKWLACDALAALADGGLLGAAVTDTRSLGMEHRLGGKNIDSPAAPPPPNAANGAQGLHLNTIDAQSSWASVSQDNSIDATLTDLPAGVTPLTAIQIESLRATGATGVLTLVQLAQMRVAALNVGDLTAPTSEEAARWLQRHCADWSILDHLRGFEIIRWRTGILKAQRRARLTGEIFDSMLGTAPDDVVRGSDTLSLGSHNT
ncbi:hypothetical protein C8F04DRAFT_1188921 [Mycena alexandri]|uniref:Uncharacterized protein n=1 Tax=Mycena alexandri TaxID=1745969 RepID=A0AAD6WWR9_9AGAR|nr:hypothetical protein C8F04DRAFT_1188921 [Mycena alexandri]